MDDVECDVTVVGAGVVGLAVARALALAGRDVTVLEAARTIGSGTSSRNSEVIHAGLYYKPASLKASFCVAGRAALYAYCLDRGIAHRRCGKIVVAHDEAEMGRLETLMANGVANGVDDLALLDERETRALEPALDVVGALLSPSTGIVDSHGLMLALRGDLEAAGGAVSVETVVTHGDVAAGLTLWTGGREPARIATRALVNCAGLGAQALALRLEGFPTALVPPSYFAKGNYFALSGKAPFARLVYPLPEPGGIGVHATIDLAGRVRFGPDVEWIEDPADLQVDPTRADAFAAAIRRYWPGLPDGALSPDYAGVRPKLSRNGEATDFMFQAEADHGIAGLVNLFGIESPGLTSCLAIGAHVARILTS